MAATVSKGLPIFLVLLSLSACIARKHGFTIKDEDRPTFELSNFGFLRNGLLKVEIEELRYVKKELYTDVELNSNFGFSLVKTASDGVSSYMEQHDEKCILRNPPSFSKQVSLALITLDLVNHRIIVDKHGSDFQNLHFQSDSFVSSKNPNLTSPMVTMPPTTQVSVPGQSPAANNSNEEQQTKSTLAPDKSSPVETVPTNSTAAPTTLFAQTDANQNGTSSPNQINGGSLPNSHRRRRDAQTTVKTDTENLPSEPEILPLEVIQENESTVARGNFVVHIKDKAEEGLYNLYFHDCHNYKHDQVPIMVNLKVSIVEENDGNYLSAGEEPLPYMFGVMSAIFFCTAFYWLHVLKVNREFLYKVHYMMFILILLKALDLMFQAVNFHFISVSGTRQESWAVLYYITHLLKGALLFTTIVLIGTGYFFVKHVLSDRDKKIFIIVIPLQILANTAQIVMDSTEEAKVQYHKWKQVFIMVDLLCCGAILFPVVWSIKHLQEASKTDGKAALNLVKLKLFRHFYVMIVCYIYFTRIIVALVEMTVPFQYIWLDEFLQNTATLVFFVLTGYKFRPAPDNPYLHVPQADSDDEIEMDEVVTTSGMSSGVTRVVRVDRGDKNGV